MPGRHPGRGDSPCSGTIGRASGLAGRYKVTTNLDHVRWAGCMLLLLLGLVPGQPSRASEYGISGYFLGLTAPLAGYNPPPGIYYRNSFFLYHGTFYPNNQRTTYNLLANVGIIAWYPEWDFFGASPGFSAVVPFLGVRNKMDTTSIGLDGSRQVSTTTQTVDSIADTEYSAILGWHAGPHHWNVVLTGFMPTGHYAPYQLGITGLNRPGLDLRGAYTYLGETGLEVSGALGVTVNAINTATNYRSGAELHFEWTVHQYFPFGLHAGVSGFVFQQLTPDSGSGATLGPFIGRVFSIGPSIGYAIKVDGRVIDLSGRWYHDFGAQNHPQGDSIFASLGFRF